MANKKLLYAGIIFLTLGILLKILTNWTLVSTVLIGCGAVGKVVYLLNRIALGNYKPGLELGFLVFGLSLFFVGIYLRSHSYSINHWYFMGPGILFKLGFIVLFIRKIKAK